MKVPAMNWNPIQLTIYGLLGSGLIISAVNGVGDAGFFTTMVVFGALCGVIFFLDVFYFSKWRGTWPCPICGCRMTPYPPLLPRCLKCNPFKKIDFSKLPEPSERVRKICDDPQGSKIAAVKAYRDEAGSSLWEAKAVVERYMEEQDD